ARELDATIAYTWQPQRRGFVRTTLGAGVCDVMMEAPSSFERVLVTAPLYRSTYVFVVRRDVGPSVRSFDDPVLRHARVGVQLVVLLLRATAPPPHGVDVAYVSNERGAPVSVIHLADGHVIDTGAFGGRPRGIQPAPGGARVYVAVSRPWTGEPVPEGIVAVD